MNPGASGRGPRPGARPQAFKGAGEGASQEAPAEAAGRLVRFGGRARRRMFESGELRLVLLLLLESEPRHGYDLIRDIEARTGGSYSPSPGVIYPTLTLLQDLGHIAEVTAGAGKKLYMATSAGASYLSQHRAEAEASVARLDQLRRRTEAFDAGPVFRAMTNLKAVLQQRLVDPADKEILFSAAEILDEAARKIERL